MIVCLLDVISNLVLKRQHTLNIKISCPCYQVFCIFSGELEPNEMASVVQISILNQLWILNGMPSGRLNHTNRAALLSRHNLMAYIGVSHTTPSEVVKFTVILKRFRRKVICLKFRLVIVDYSIRASGILRNLC